MSKLLLRDYHGSESAFRESLRLAKHSGATQPQAEHLVLQALNNGSLGWILAMTGQLPEAEQFTESARQSWEQLIQAYPERGSWNTPLAVSHRNLAMIREALQQDGLSDAQKSVELASRSLERPAALSEIVGNETSVLHFDTLIDSEQLFGMLCWHHGKRAEAKASCQTSIRRLQAMLSTIKATYDGNSAVATTARSDRYEEALVRIGHNLELLREDADQKSDGVTIKTDPLPSEDWQWKPLVSRPGEILPIDFVLRGNRFPGEFEPQDALLLSWQYEWANEAMTSIISAVQDVMPVVLIVDHASQQRQAERELKTAGVSLDRVQFFHRPTESLWVRDFGPLSVQSASGAPLWIDAVYPFTVGLRRFADDGFPQALAEQSRTATAALPYLLEGGGLLSNGAGLCLVTTYLLERNQQQGMNEAELTAAIRQYLGAEQVVYLEPLKDEPTRHLDWFCAFTSPDTIVVGEYVEDRANAELLDRHADRLAELAAPGGTLNVVRIPMPPRGREYFGGSYTNVIFANGVLIVPTWPEASAEVEQQVLELYQQLLPGWRIVPVPSRRFGYRAGGPRCCSMNLLLPKGTRTRQGQDRGT